MAANTSLYKAIWFWDPDTALNYQISDTMGLKSTKLLKRTFTATELSGERKIEFLENVDLNQQRVFKNMYQRVVQQDVYNVVTLQDVKDVVTFLLVGYLPRDVIALFHCYPINRLFRALIVYFQLYLQVWEDLEYRRQAYLNKRLKHPISTKRESRCRSSLSKLRSRIGQEYGQLVCGEGVYRKYHHMNNPINRSYSAKDNTIYDYLFKFSARVVWVTLLRSNYKEIEQELSRLFQYKPSTTKDIFISKNDRSVLRGNKTEIQNHWELISPVIADIFQNEDDTELLAPKKIEEIFKEEMSGMDACLELPEELLHRFRLTIGILGQSRDNFEVMLHVKQNTSLSTEEKEIEKALAVVETMEKPTYKMNGYLSQLETSVHLYKPYNLVITQFEDVKEEILYCLSNHVEDSRKTCSLWKKVKGFPTL